MDGEEREGGNRTSYGISPTPIEGDSLNLAYAESQCGLTERSKLVKVGVGRGNYCNWCPVSQNGAQSTREAREHTENSPEHIENNALTR